VGPRAGLDAVVKGKSPCPCGELNPGRPARNQVSILTELARFLIEGKIIYNVSHMEHQDYVVQNVYNKAQFLNRKAEQE
jgi:hypothetical protein